ncbi:MAG: UDP-N-acetylglucosamine 2-epimerase (non-hydrolyzing) [Vicinamibacterales bacterium]
MARPLRVTFIAGTRPNFVKVAPLIEAARQVPDMVPLLVHTGQHYDERMSDQLFTDLGMPAPDIHLRVGSANHAVQTALIMTAFDASLDAHPVDMVVVVGDVNSTLACTLVAVKRGIPVAHVEAGLRSGDRSMPEEINRIVTDSISDYLFTTETAAGDALRAEGIRSERIFFVGNVMIDSLLKHREVARARTGPRALAGLEPKTYALCTLHRPSNVDTLESATRTLSAVSELAARLPVVLPLHPRSTSQFQQFGLLDALKSKAQVMPPLGYLDFLSMLDHATLVLTDSGGIQEEATVLGVPCLTFRENTERPITITEGTNRLVGLDPANVARAVDDLLHGPAAVAKRPALWDGHAAQRIVAILDTVGRAPITR